MLKKIKVRLTAELEKLSKKTLCVQNLFLRESLDNALKENFTMETLVQKQAETIANLKELNKNLRREVYGDKAETHIQTDTEIDPDDLEESDIPSKTDSTQEPIQVNAYTRKPYKPRGRRINFSSLPKEVRVFDLPENAECPCCTHPLQRAKYDIRYLIHHIPAKTIVYEDHIAVGICPKHCPGAMGRVKTEPRFLNRMPITEEMLAYIVFTKLINRQPLYHQERMFQVQSGLMLPRQNISEWFNKGAFRLIPLINLLKEVFLEYKVCGIDSTRLLVLKVDKEPDSKEQIKKLINMYCFLGGPPGREIVIFEPSFWKHSEYLLEWFMDYVGYIHCDADPLYKKLGAVADIILALCNAHARRRFEKVMKYSKNSDLSSEMMDLYSDLYTVERDIRLYTDPEKKRLERQIRSVPILQKMKQLLDKFKDKVLKKTGIGRAVLYTYKYWDGLIQFLQDGRIPIDNNSVERKILAFAMNRKNFLFTFSMAGAEAIGIYMSLLQTAILHKLDPLAYITALLKRVPYCHNLSDYERLLPWNIDLVKIPSGQMVNV